MSTAGVVARDQLAGRASTLRAPVVVNAVGPWLDQTLKSVEPEPVPLLRLTKGVHLVTPAATRHAVVLFAESDNRLFFVVPWLGFSLVGTTDTDFTGDPRQARATTEDIDYLVAAVDQAFPDAPWRQIYYTTAGVRALAYSPVFELRHVELRHLPGALVLLLAADRPPGHVDARAGPRHRLHVEQRRHDRVGLGRVQLVEEQRRGLRDVQPAGRALALVRRRQLRAARRASAEAPHFPPSAAFPPFSSTSAPTLTASRSTWCSSR